MIGICIKYFHESYGGMLQALATVKTLEKRGIDYELIRYVKSYTLWQKIKQIPRLFNAILLNDKLNQISKKVARYKYPDFAKNEAVRKKCFSSFCNRMFVKVSPEFVGYDNLHKGAKRYSAIVTGSDQLWSPAGLETNFYNLMFVPKNIRTISIASSFGVGQIPSYQVKKTRQYLQRIDFISMRETRGSEIVKELTGRDVPTILDPVFYLEKSEWDELIPTNIEFDEPYIFAFLLGKNPEHRKAVQMAAERFNCKIVTMHHLNEYVKADENFGDIVLYDVDPTRFLNLLRGAEYVCTDSFHGTVFSIIYNKQFVVFNRYAENVKHSKNSRIDTLCSNVELQNQRCYGCDDICEKISFKIDYCKVGERLDMLKKYTFEYIDKVLTVNN